MKLTLYREERLDTDIHLAERLDTETLSVPLSVKLKLSEKDETQESRQYP